MKPSLVALALAAQLAVPAHAFAAADTPPTAPGNPSVKRYAGAGGELFWQRSKDDRGVRGYEITKNGQQLGLRDATSYYDASLKPNTGYTFTVTAVDTAGQKSPVATVKVGGGSSAPVQTPTTGTPSTPTKPSEAPPVPAPAGLRATVYSRSNAELFWNRIADPVLRYEVRRDGAVVATGDFTSYYAPNLAAGRDYAYEVVAIDLLGRRSSAARVSFRTDSKGTVAGTAGTPTAPVMPANPMAPVPGKPPTTAPTTPTTPTTTPSTPATNAALAPVGLKLAVYSGSTAELLWTPGDQGKGPILKNEVRRDGKLVATLAGYGLRSYLDKNRTSGAAYTYEVTAISASGKASATVGSGSATRPTPVPAPMADVTLPADVAGKLAVDFELLNGVAIEKIHAVGRRLRNPEALGLRRTASVPTDYDPSTTNETWACPKGGTIRTTRTRNVQPDGVVAIGLESTFEVRDCAIGSLVVSGDFIVPADGEYADSTVYADGRNLSIDDARDLSTIEAGTWGGYYIPGRPERSSFDAGDLKVETVNASYGAVRLAGYAADTANALPDGSLGYTVTASGVTGGLGGNASIVTDGPFEFANGRDAGKPSGGRLSIASGQDTWKIDAFNGDAGSFTFTTSVKGATTSVTVPWSDGYRFKGIDPSKVQLGF